MCLGLPNPPHSLGQQANSCPVLQLSAGAITRFHDYLHIKGQTAASVQGQGGCECWVYSSMH